MPEALPYQMFESDTSVNYTLSVYRNFADYYGKMKIPSQIKTHTGSALQMLHDEEQTSKFKSPAYVCHS